MALKLHTTYPGRFDSPSENYPQGKWRNRSNSTAHDGGYLEEKHMNDIYGFFGALLHNAEMSPNGEVDTAKKSQFYDALMAVAKKAVGEEGYRKLDDNVFNGLMAIKSDNDEQGVGILLQESDGTVRGQVVATDQGLQLTQYPKDGGSQTFTFPSEGGELLTDGNGKWIMPAVEGTLATLEELEVSSASVPVTLWGASDGSHHTLGKLPDNLEKTKGLVSIGSDNLSNSTYTNGVVAIGDGVMTKGVNPTLSNAIGLFSQHNSSGHRNESLGSLSLFGLTTGSHNVAVGRDAGQCIIEGKGNTALGYGSISGDARMGFDNAIKTAYALNGQFNIAVGYNPLVKLQGVSSDNISIGRESFYNLKAGKGVIAIGANAGKAIQNNYSESGFKCKRPNTTHNYSMSGGVLEITNVPDDAVEGGLLVVKFLSGDLNVNTDVKFLKKEGNAFTTWLGEGFSTTQASGELTLISYDISKETASESQHTVIVGYNSLSSSLESLRNTLIGSGTCTSSNNVEDAVVLGSLACTNSKTVTKSVVSGSLAANTSDVTDSVVSGFEAARYAKKTHGSVVLGNQSARGTGSVLDTVIVGQFSGGGNGQDTYRSTFIGGRAGDSSPSTELDNCTALGFNSQVSGSNQVQLGNADTTTYVFGTVQNRSDRRDKIGISDLNLGLDLVLKLRPTEFKWNYREWGNKQKGNRKHAGFIAQEINEVVDPNEYAFVQDHSVKGGSDVLTVGYDEFIPVLVKAIQEQQEEINMLKEELRRLNEQNI